MQMRAARIRTVISAAIALLLGLIGFSLFFSDLASGESPVNRVFMIILFFFISGLVIGFLNPRTWMLSGLTAWLCVVFGAVILFRGAASDDHPAEYQTLRIVVAEEKIDLDSAMLNVGKVYVEQVNEGMEDHELSFFAIADDSELERLKRGQLRNLTMSGSMRPLEPGDSSVSIYADVFKPAHYAVVCLRQSPEGLSHISLGEIAEFTVQ